MKNKPSHKAVPRGFRQLVILTLIGAFVLYRIHVAVTDVEIYLERQKLRQQIVEKIEPARVDWARFRNDVGAYGERDDIDPEYKRYLYELGIGNVNHDENGIELYSIHQMSNEIRRKIIDGYKAHGFNAFASNLINVKRNLGDPRSEECKSRIYTDLPKCSIVITFHNEEWSMLLRAVHSVISRSPNELVEEILLVDDASDRVELHEKLEKHFEKFPKVKIVRTPVARGIIQARMFGFNQTKAPVIVSLDGHVEVMHGWLEPVLDRFKYQDELLVTMWYLPINKRTLKINSFNRKELPVIGGLKWNLSFKFLNLSIYEGKNLTHPDDPKLSPTIFDSMFAIRKDYFMKIGMYDSVFDVWGVGDIELAIRVWCCGGKVEIVPCSRVSHMDKEHKYNIPLSKYRWNTDRVAELWLDEYKIYYYRSVGATKNRTYGDISERVTLRKSLKCKPFKWFYENIYKNISIPIRLREASPKKASQDLSSKSKRIRKQKIKA